MQFLAKIIFIFEKNTCLFLLLRCTFQRKINREQYWYYKLIVCFLREKVSLMRQLKIDTIIGENFNGFVDLVYGQYYSLYMLVERWIDHELQQ